jgi:epoxyqueuosine reductase QueG
MTTEKASATRCPTGHAHRFTYLGYGRQAYRCDDCLTIVAKSRLKAETDGAEVDVA